METNKHTLKLEKTIEIIAWPIILVLILYASSKFRLQITDRTIFTFTGITLAISLFYYFLTHTLIKFTKLHFLKSLTEVIFLAILMFVTIQTHSYISLIVIIPLIGALLLSDPLNPLIISFIGVLLIAVEITIENFMNISIGLDPVYIFIIISAVLTIFTRLMAQSVKYNKTIKDELQSKFAEANERLAQLEIHGKEFPTLAAQQIFTPLATIQSFIQTLQSEQDGKLNPKQKEFVTETSKYIEKMHKLIKELLYISGLEFTKSIPLKPTDALDTIKSTIEKYKPQVEEHKMKINLNLPSENLPSILADKNTLPDIFARILDNAIRYSPPESSIDITIQIFHKNDGAYLYTEIKDLGYGIPQEEQKYIFRKFFRGTNIIDKYNEGKGLSLYIVKLLLDGQNAKIHFKSKVNEGSTFQIGFPIISQLPQNSQKKMAA